MSMWWDLKNTLSYNALFNFVVGSRGCGKTYGFKKWAAEDFIKNGYLYHCLVSRRAVI